MSVPDVRVAGIDWAADNHALCVVDAAGEPVERLVVAHTKAGIGKAVGLLCRHQVAGVEVFVIPPSQVKALRRRYGSAGHKDDRFDAYVLADTVRTDRRRLTPLRPDTHATTTLRT